jgi:hypothetical protein
MRGAKKPLSVDFTSNMDEGSGLLPSELTPTPIEGVWENEIDDTDTISAEIKMANFFILKIKKLKLGPT